MHETNKRILAELPGTAKEIAEKLQVNEKTVYRRLKFMVLLKRVKAIGKSKAKPDNIKGSTVFGELDDKNAWLDSDQFFKDIK